MATHYNFFNGIDSGRKGTVCFADDEKFDAIQGVGSGIIKFIVEGKEVTFNVKNVHVHTLCSSSLSVKKLAGKGFRVQFKHHHNFTS